MERCSNHTILIYGSSNKPYTVSVKDLLPTCTCPAFAINKNRAKSMKPGVRYATATCKHIQAQFDRLCRFRGEPVIPGLCPRCSSEMEWIPDDEEEAL